MSITAILSVLTGMIVLGAIVCGVGLARRWYWGSLVAFSLLGAANLPMAASEIIQGRQIGFFLCLALAGVFFGVAFADWRRLREHRRGQI